jgi:hypothetical protein
MVHDVMKHRIHHIPEQACIITDCCRYERNIVKVLESRSGEEAWSN